MQYRLAQEKDFQAILRLQNQNLISVMSDEEKAGGFLSTAFSIEDFREMNRELGVVVSYDQDYLCGYLAASTVNFNQRFPIPTRMIHRLKAFSYDSFFIASPICIEKSYRKGRVYINLCKKLVQHLPDYRLAISLVAASNVISLKTLIKLGFEKIDEFKADKLFYILICDLEIFRKRFNPSNFRPEEAA